MTNEEWERCVGIITSKLSGLLASWCDDNITDTRNPRQQDEWLDKTKREYDTNPNRFSSIKRNIYNYLKTSLPKA